MKMVLFTFSRGSLYIDWEFKKTCGLYYKNFMAVINNHNETVNIIFDHNDSDQYYETMILVTLAIARSVNYYHRVRCKLERTLRS